MSCEPEKITGYVDDRLDPATRADVEGHLASCIACRDQMEFERAAHERLRSLAPADLPAALEERVRRAAARARPRPLRWILPVAAVLALLALWGRGTAPFVAWELARDHAHCFGLGTLPAEVWTGDARVVASWFEKRGTRLPRVPDSGRGVELVGARYCRLLDQRSVAHLYYAEGDSRVSLFVVPGAIRLREAYATGSRGYAVRLLRVAGTTVGLVGNKKEDVDSFQRALTSTVALNALSFDPASR